MYVCMYECMYVCICKNSNIGENIKQPIFLFESSFRAGLFSSS